MSPPESRDPASRRGWGGKEPEEEKQQNQSQEVTHPRWQRTWSPRQRWVSWLQDWGNWGKQPALWGEHSRESQRRQPLGAGDAAQRCSGTYPSGQQVKAEFVLTGAQVNDALEVRGTEPRKHSRGCQQKAPGAHEAAKWSSAISTFPLPHLVFAQALPSTGFPDRISPFLKLCANAFSSRKPSLKSHLQGIFSSSGPQSALAVPLESTGQFPSQVTKTDVQAFSPLQDGKVPEDTTCPRHTLNLSRGSVYRLPECVRSKLVLWQEQEEGWIYNKHRPWAAGNSPCGGDPCHITQHPDSKPIRHCFHRTRRRAGTAQVAPYTVPEKTHAQLIPDP